MDREHFDLTFLKLTEIFNQIGNLEHHQNVDVHQKFANNQTSRQLNAYKNSVFHKMMKMNTQIT